MDHSQIHSLIETAPYELGTATKLEALVAQQSSSGRYDFVANKALLRNYQVNSTNAKIDVVASILILSLMRLPSTDFISLNYLIPAQFVSHATVVAIQEAAALLERGHYLAFWESFVVPSNNVLFQSAVGFVDLVRLFILGNLRDTYTSIPKNLFSQQLGLNESSIEPFCAGNSFIEKVCMKTECVVFYSTSVMMVLAVV
jgi:hypothetical protein